MYTDTIRGIDPKINAVGVECFMRVQYGTLDHLSRQEFAEETALARLTEEATPGEMRACADSYSRAAEFDRYSQEYLGGSAMLPGGNRPAGRNGQAAQAAGPESLRQYDVSWRRTAARCESNDPYSSPRKCTKPGEGWVIDRKRIPSLISMSFLCAEHAEKSIAAHARCNSETEFVPGIVQDESRSLSIEWRVKTA